MYRVLHFRGGVYKFDELAEFVEDVGGLVLSEDHFEIIRGDSYLSTEIHVLLMVPENELKPLKSIISEIKGMYEHLNPTEEQRVNLLLYLSIYDVLDKNKWIKKEDVIELIKCPCYALLCKGNKDTNCILDNKFEEILEEMNTNQVIESKSDDKDIFYRLKKK
ncbi:MAG: methyl-coenzyme M reductase family protein [Methanobacterium sp.]